MTTKVDTEEFVQISRKVWEWARNRPEYHDLIEDLEDLELIAQSRLSNGKNITLEEYHQRRLKNLGL